MIALNGIHAYRTGHQNLLSSTSGSAKWFGIKRALCMIPSLQALSVAVSSADSHRGGGSSGRDSAQVVKST